MSRFLVTGCAGFVGSHLTDALLAAGHLVVGVDAFTDYYAREVKERNLESAREDPGFRLVERDLAADGPPSLERIDGVFHLAGEPGVRASWGSFDRYAWNNLVATRRVFEAASDAGLRVVFASSSSVYGDAEVYPTAESTTPRPISPYGITKHGCEELAYVYGRSFGLDVVTLRYFSVYGPRQRPDMAFARIVGAVVEGTPFDLYGSGHQSRDFTYVDDAVAATVSAFELAASGDVLIVGGGEEASLWDVVATVERLAGRTLDVRVHHFADGDARRTRADTQRVHRALGWEPRVSLETGLARQLESAGAREAATVPAA
ncbi:MAG: GDP-mannose 4,6-dehydratase [Actinomycetota bacterium]|nr:GDP-mannose 4,6-dehydratase [Actinomycetota bacterium]